MEYGKVMYLINSSGSLIIVIRIMSTVKTTLISTGWEIEFLRLLEIKRYLTVDDNFL